MELSTIKDIAQVTALLSTGAYFLYKLFVGQLIVNLSLSATCQRFSLEGQPDDIVVCNILLKKGERGTVELHDAQIKATFNGKFITQPLLGIDRRSCITESISEKKIKKINWEKRSEKSPFLNLSPGEESNFSCRIFVPKGEVCDIEFILLGKRKNHQKVSQWRASCISVPI
jgi:hypothetical protein